MRFLLVLVLVAGCAAKPKCEVQPVPASARDGAFLWRATKGEDVLWLYGTIHDAGLEAVPPGALKALDTAARLVSELGNDEPDRDTFRELARIAAGPGIDQQLPASDWYDLRDALLGVIKEDDLRRAQPWYAMTLLTTHLTPGGGPSMDVLLAKRAADAGKPVEPLESWREQLTALQGAVGIADLQQAIHARASMRCDLERLRRAYEAGDTRTMEALLVIPQTEATMLTARNTKWLPALEGYKGSTFVAVGLGHLLGTHGLPVLLRRDGYAVERVGGP
ncbi:MAG TPA: TraB/GumN family protein [Kofleriaceae bacterium]|nr:TraB/GumN family protein [Kofleriaceae bacterium]